MGLIGRWAICSALDASTTGSNLKIPSFAFSRFTGIRRALPRERLGVWGIGTRIGVDRTLTVGCALVIVLEGLNSRGRERDLGWGVFRTVDLFDWVQMGRMAAEEEFSLSAIAEFFLTVVLGRTRIGDPRTLGFRAADSSCNSTLLAESVWFVWTVSSRGGGNFAGMRSLTGEGAL
jgi:hypothetical protein